MSKLLSIYELLREANQQRGSRSSYLRAVKACDEIGLTGDERIELLSSGYFGFIDPVTRELRERYRGKAKAK